MTDGQLTFFGTVISAVIIAVVGAIAAWYTARASERRGVGSNVQTLPTGQTLDANTVPAQLVTVLHDMSRQLSEVMTDRDHWKSEVDRRDARWQQHLQDVQDGAESGIYPPWPPHPIHD